jgi:hypothetical protein
MRRPDHVRVTSRRNHRGLTTSVECDLCGTVQPLVAPGRRTPSQPDIQRVIHLFGALHDQTCRDRVAGLVETMMADGQLSGSAGELPAEQSEVQP